MKITSFWLLSGFKAEKEPDVLASVTIDDVRDVINIGSANVPDTKITKMLKRAEITLELELGKEIDFQNCTNAEEAFIAILAAKET
jgi:hypothetical protein